MEFENLTETIIGCAFKVYKKLGFGFLESVSKITAAHEVQLVNYLTATEKPVGLILNFSTNGVEVRRKVRNLPLKNPVHPVNPV